jgi:hypothetical protein
LLIAVATIAGFVMALAGCGAPAESASTNPKADPVAVKDPQKVIPQGDKDK